ncbi:disulfide bond formation protein B [Deinococcus metallilatus]|uniref:Disulfide bond formation protein B n=1 Tax=Deinococcus metallilatus TaxID=1211322 RepID=A0AAJ5F5N0_9DEIO|nr:disulfide bond formation protein B [Deinococcus metallilatus]MBB5294023.1 disulfide bond formation protein DsbB [Deinococcus metallilatus]QBY08814.1 disulfide bond formation protein B [Deinococcus metallilatus]RXJ09958.1 disulfide bond formation protein B [Deinococcus metallilatus]TLK28105.1 disulfide bond formation protein B [Deinococcus metallilatus]GMA16644.1 putative disulfide formation protein [Deinococcus metallilatus]
MTRDNRLYLAWVVALLATLGSLYFSEVRGFKPCILCWYQRVMMYPLAVILGIAALGGDLGIRRYALPLAAIGWLVALYQNLETWGVVPTLRACTTDPASSCGIPWPIWGSGTEGLARLNTVITIPVLSLIAFTLILGLLGWGRGRR